MTRPHYHAIIVAAVTLAACGETPVTSPTPQPSRQPVRIVITDGDQQSAAAGMPLPTPMTVMLTDEAGSGVPGVVVHFQVNGGGGWITETDVFTDASGRASTIWYMGPRPGNANFLGAYSSVGTTGYRAYASPLEPGNTYRGADGYIEMRIGDLPLLLSVPHGGTLAPASIPTRTEPAAGDAFTVELAREIESAVAAHGRGAPSLVTSLLSPSKLDPDRPISPGAQGDRIAERAWREYHGFLAAARAYMQDRHTRGMYVDLHGHSHEAERVEIGYLITAGELAAPNATLDHPSYPLKSSIRGIAQENHPAFSSILRGDPSLGALIADEGFRAMPSPDEPAPASAQYLSGGYSLERYGSREGGLISGILLQTPASLRSSAAERSRFATSFAGALDRYYTGFFGTALYSR